MFESLPIGIFIVGLIVVAWRLYRYAFRELDRAEVDAVGPVTLTRQERAAIRDLERQFGRTSEHNPLVR